MGATPEEDEQTLPVEIRIGLVNDRGHGMGKPLPAGIVRVEVPASSGIVEFAGEGRIGHVAEGERIDLRIGEATDLVATRRMTDYRETGTKPYEAEASALVSLAKARLSDAYTLAVNEAVQMHGGIGMTDEHEIGFFMKRARACEMTFGDAAFHRDRYAGLTGF